MEEMQWMEDCYASAQPHNSIVTSSVVSSVQGKFGSKRKNFFFFVFVLIFVLLFSILCCLCYFLCFVVFVSFISTTLLYFYFPVVCSVQGRLIKKNSGKIFDFFFSFVLFAFALFLFGGLCYCPFLFMCTV
jgi:hypothetical protein